MAGAVVVCVLVVLLSYFSCFMSPFDRFSSLFGSFASLFNHSVPAVLTSLSSRLAFLYDYFASFLYKKLQSLCNCIVSLCSHGLSLCECSVSLLNQFVSLCGCFTCF